MCASIFFSPQFSMKKLHFLFLIFIGGTHYHSLSCLLYAACILQMGINYLHECKPDPIIHCHLRPKNVLLDDGGQLKVAGFGLIKMLKISPDRYKLVNPMADTNSSYVAPELYKNEIFDKSVDSFSFGLILYEVCQIHFSSV
ncbi:serine threonine protein kinase [Musa troglodytarum]|uniref:Serine threonine protein kinase n=1 Tax=Musa troglodytarum TaxID=320322 RepID=A0A9E7H669_9LILI|nr:serine threonine protein kinase [Musa troglodytarum]